LLEKGHSRCIEGVQFAPQVQPRVSGSIRLLCQFLIGSFPGGLAGLGGDFLLGEVFRLGFPRQGFYGFEFIVNVFEFILNLVLDFFLVFVLLLLKDVLD
jgi:hypothetical protein